MTTGHRREYHRYQYTPHGNPGQPKKHSGMLADDDSPNDIRMPRARPEQAYSRRTPRHDGPYDRVLAIWLTIGGYLGNLLDKRQVLRGSLAGMRYLDESICSRLAPKLLGTYERELQPGIDATPNGGYHTIVNVGAGEGSSTPAWPRPSHAVRHRLQLTGQHRHR